MFAPEEEELTAEHIRALVQKRQELHDTLLEFVHYAFYLAKDLEEGLQVYQRFREDALYSGDDVLFHLLHAETLQSLGLQRAYGAVEAQQNESAEVRAYWARRLEAIDRARTWLEAEALAHQVGEALFLRQASKDVPELAEKIRKELAARSLPGALVDGWEALAQMYQGHLDLAEKRLTKMKEGLEDIPQAKKGTYVWWLANLAWGYFWSYSGYLARLQGHIYKAQENYKRALPYWRGLVLPFHEAATRNDLGFATMLVGDESAAKSFCIDALNLRREAGVQSFLVLSLTTLASIEWRDEHYDAALQYANKAERIAQAIGFTRGLALARMIKAIALRLKYNPERMPNPKVRQRYLREAQEEIEMAIAVLPIGSSARWDARHIRLQILRDLARAHALTWDDVFDEIHQYIQDADEAEYAYATWNDGMKHETLLARFEEVLSWMREHPIIKTHMFTEENKPEPALDSLPEIWNQLARFFTGWGFAWRYGLSLSRGRGCYRTLLASRLHCSTSGFLALFGRPLRVKRCNREVEMVIRL